MKYYLCCILICLLGCSPSQQEKAKNLYETQCSNCHIAPSPQDLPKHLWRESVLPEMAARMGIKDSIYNPYSKYSFVEQEAMMKTGIYTIRPTISLEDWRLLKEYIIKSAPETLDALPDEVLNLDLSQFTAKPINLDSIKGSSITFMDIDSTSGIITTSDITGSILAYDYKKNTTFNKDTFETAVTSFISKDSSNYVTLVGNLNPSEIPSGSVYRTSSGQIDMIASELHRPVHASVYDFDEDGTHEIVISEFGNLTGNLSLLRKKEDHSYEKRTLLGQAGTIRTIVKDMNGDGMKDIIALTTQGNEGITILYQKNGLRFGGEQVIRFNPVYGSSWFDLIDYNNDGYDDIITVHGDNADKTYVHKPYHGLRIHINNGQNQFEEKYFYPIYGATRFVAHDFDEDGDIDIGVVSSFPDYENRPEFSFVYLKNIQAEEYIFESYGLKDPSLGRWLLIDSGDVDGDGDQDIILSSFSYYFTPVPDNLFKKWSASDVDLMVLENVLR